jgi:MoaA/NifB/PqqE/SkfB family radical SAM enzyme
LTDECICDGDPFVRPNGNVHQCGCLDSPCVGNVFDGFEPLEYRSDKEYEDPWQCYKKRLDYIDGSNQYHVNSHD